MQLTGANIKLALEQQWQPTGSSRPFLRLGASEGFTHTYDPTAPAGQRITGMWLNGVPDRAGHSYSVTVNSFLAAGGDNFPAFKNGTGTADTGKSDLTAMVDYMAEFAAVTPLAAPTEQSAVGIDFPVGAPATYWPGAPVAFKVSSLAMSTAADLKDTQLTVKLGSDHPRHLHGRQHRRHRGLRRNRQGLGQRVAARKRPGRRTHADSGRQQHRHVFRRSPSRSEPLPRLSR